MQQESEKMKGMILKKFYCVSDSELKKTTTRQILKLRLYDASDSKEKFIFKTHDFDEIYFFKKHDFEEK